MNIEPDIHIKIITISKAVVCPECNGEGSAMGGRTSTNFICNKCNGTGKLTNDK